MQNKGFLESRNLEGMMSKESYSKIQLLETNKNISSLGLIKANNYPKDSKN